MIKGLIQQQMKTGLIDKIVKTKDLRTFDFHEMEGKPQTKEHNSKIHDQIVNHPKEPMTPGGESFEHAVNRAFTKLDEIMKQKGNFIITTHNSMYGLLKLWNEKGQPDKLDKKFREEYTSQDTPEKNQKSTGQFFVVDGRIYICRHGETEDNAKGVFRTSETKLTEKGKKQAEDMGKELKGKKISKIYTSDLPRAVETSKIISNIIK